MDYQGRNLREFLQTNGHVVLQRVDNNYNLRSFTLKEIEDITNGYCTVLGEGGFGEVYKGKLNDQRPVAVKRYKNGTKKEEFAKEVIVHSQINHKNVVRLLGCCTEENALMIVMEFVCNGNLYNILHCSNANGPVPFPLENRLDIAIELAEVLSCMHSMYSPVLHGDIKPANILLDENYLPKISDFGIARLLSTAEAQHTNTVIGPIGYMDPLYINSGKLTPKSDVYSFGVLLLELITRKKAVDRDTILTQSFNDSIEWKKVRQLFDEETTNEKKNVKLLEGIAKLAAECLKMDDKKRPEMVDVADELRTIRKALQHRKGRSSAGGNYGFSGRGNVVQSISLDELKKITRNFSVSALIGKGSDTSVFHGVLGGGQKCAVKKLGPSREILLESELLAISRLKHANIVQLLGYCMEGESSFLNTKSSALVYEYAKGGSLHNTLHGTIESTEKICKNITQAFVNGGSVKMLTSLGALLEALCSTSEPLHSLFQTVVPPPFKDGLGVKVLSWKQRLKIALSAAEGLEFLHEKAWPPVIHGDIKSSNILLFDRDVAKIGDLGVSNKPPIDNILLDRVCPYISGYEAPECYTIKVFDTKSDIYSFGVVLLELLTGHKALDYRLPKGLVSWASPKLGEDFRQCMDPRLKRDYPPAALFKMAALARDCLHEKANYRPSMGIVVRALRAVAALDSPVPPGSI